MSNNSYYVIFDGAEMLPRGTLRIVPTMVVTSNTNTSWKAKNQSLATEARAALAVTRTAKIKRSGSNDFRGIENQQTPRRMRSMAPRHAHLTRGQQLQWVDSELNKPMPPTIQGIFSPPMSGLQLQLCPRPSLSKFSTGKSYLPKTLLIIKIILLSKTYMWIGGSLTSSCDSSSFPVLDSSFGIHKMGTWWVRWKKSRHSRWSQRNTKSIRHVARTWCHIFENNLIPNSYTTHLAR